MRFVAATLMLVFVVCAMFGAFTWFFFSIRTRRDAAQEAGGQLAEAIGRIAAMDELSKAQVESAMRILRDQSRLEGEPSLQGTATVSGKSVPDLHLGRNSEVLNFKMVDRVKELAGGTATLFAWDGAGFVRVTTNVMKPDGTRAVGTMLDPRGKAFAALSHGRPFNGVVDILGVPYTTSYMPMLDSGGKLVGAWYTGFRLDSIASLGRSIEKSQILDRGFTALLKPSGDVLFHGKQVSEQELMNVKAHAEGWVVQEETYPAWGYTVLAAYPVADVVRRQVRMLGILTGETCLLVGLIILLQFALLRRLILGPVHDLTDRLENANLNTIIESGRNDEIGMLAAAFNRFVMRLREILLDVRVRSGATTDKSEEIRGVSEGVAARMIEQSSIAGEAAEDVAQLSRDIAVISGHTLDASKQARSATDAARDGGKLVSTVVSQMQELSRETQASVARIQSLSEHARQIGSIVGVIDEIAEGTNLLALNASIEAARAGEHGRGFAVVAGEVRRLSERTAQATRQVAGLIGGITRETEQAAIGIDQACRRAVEGASAVASLNSTFDRIVGMVAEVDGRVEQIAQSADRETSTAIDVSGMIRRVAESARETEASTELVMGATGELLDAAKAVQSMVEQFHLVDTPRDGRA